MSSGAGGKAGRALQKYREPSTLVLRNIQQGFSWFWRPTTCDVHILVSSTGPATSISGTLHHAAVPLLTAMRLLFASLVFAFIITAQGTLVISTAAAERRRECGDVSSLIEKSMFDHLRLPERGGTHFARFHSSGNQSCGERSAA